MILGKIPHYKLRNAGTSNLYQFAPKNWFWARFITTSQGMQEHRTFISSLLKVVFGLNSTFLHKECRNSSFLLIDFSPNSILQISEYRNMKTLSLRFKYWFWAKFSHKGMQEHRTFISSILKLDFGQLQHYKIKNAGTSNLYQFATKNWFWTKFHSTSQGMQDIRTFISSVVKMNLGPNSTFQAKECRNIEPLSVRS